MRALIAIVMLVGCKKSPPRFEGPLRLEFGDCAAEPAWVSGPRPMPIATQTATTEQPKPKPAEPARPQEDPPRPGDDEDPAVARQQAIEQARNAGIIGSAVTQGGAFASLTGTGDISSGFDDTNIYGGLLGSDDPKAGGGSTGGWGTIGTGRYGTIGSGGGMRGRSSSVPTVSIGQPNAQGDLDKAIIRRYIKRNIQKIQYCYEKELLAKPTLKGTLQVQFLIKPTGNVESSTATGVDTEVASCVANVIKGIEFPKPKGGGMVQVNYPFTFRPADGGSATSATDYDPQEIARVVKAQSGVFKACYQQGLAKRPGLRGKVIAKFKIAGGKVTSAEAAAGSTLDDDGVKACVVDNVKKLEFPPKATVATVSFPFIFESADEPKPAEDPAPEPPKPDDNKPAVGGKPTRPYRPGANNPLAGAAAAIEDCLRTNTKPYGAVTVVFDATGLKVNGVDEAVAECVATAGATMPKPTGKGPQTCSFAFGDIPIAELPGVDVSATSVTHAGAQIATIDAIVKDDAPTFKIQALFDKLDAIAKSQKTLAIPVAIEGPLAIRAIDATPIAVINKVVATARAAGADPVLAREQPGGSWKMLHLISLPAVPVPRGTGGYWSAQARVRSDRIAVDDERVTLSILVQNDQMWVGLSRVNEFQPVPAGDYGKLREVLKQQKTSAFFADRSDIELAGEGCTYGDLAKAIEVALAVGFVDFYVSDPAGLSARPTL